MTLAQIGRSYPSPRRAIRASLGGPTLASDYESPNRAQGVLSQETASWFPPLRSGDFAAVTRRDLTLARIQDIVRNDPHAGAAVDKLVDHVVGSGLRLSSKPDGKALGIDDPKALRDFGRKIESEFRLFADDPRRFVDVERRLGLNGLLRAAARDWFTLGESALALTLCDDPSARYRTALLGIDPDRIGNPYGQMDTDVLRLGVQRSLSGAPVGYWVREAHMGDYWSPEKQTRWRFVPRATAWGRPVFIHGFEPQRTSDSRGTSPLISLIVRMRMLGKFADAELASATVNALFAATIESDAPADEVARRLTPAAQVAGATMTSMADSLDYYDQNPVTIGGVRVPVMLPNSSLKMNSSPRQTAAYSSFETAFLQSIASKMGLSYEQLKMDWSRTNYSSARAALNEVWRSIRRMSAQFVEQVVTPIYLAFADEAFDAGRLKEPKGWPDFWDMPGAYMRCRWIGPARGWIDPVKEIEAATLRMEGMISTFEIECAEQGHDYEEILDQIAVEEGELNARGLTRLSLVAAVQSAKGPKPDSEDAQGPAGPGGADTERGSSGGG